MSLESLYIVGNGFDIYHGIPSRYSDFKAFLSHVERELLDLVETYIPAQEDWSDLEAALADIDVDNIIDDASQFLMSYGAEDWSDSGHHDYQYELDRIVQELSSSLVERFGEWIRQLKIPSIDELAVQPLKLPINARYLNFNYTSSLTNIYSIPGDNILFIHGAAQEDDELVLGHAWNPVEIPSLNDVPDPESLDTRVMEGNEIINEYFEKTFKNTEKIIGENHGYFKNLIGVSKISILGHSLSPVDEAYFKEIIKNIRIDAVRWVVTFYRDEDKDHHREALHRIGVPMSAVSFCQMSEL